MQRKHVSQSANGEQDGHADDTPAPITCGASAPQRCQAGSEEQKALKLDELGRRRSHEKASTVKTHLDFPPGRLERRAIDIAGVGNGRVGHNSLDVLA